MDPHASDGSDVVTPADVPLDAPVDVSNDAATIPPDANVLSCGAPVLPTTVPRSICGNRCLVRWREGQPPQVLFDDVQHPDRSLNHIVDVSDTYVVVDTGRSIFATPPQGPSYLLAIPRTGGDPVVIDTWNHPVYHSVIASARVRSRLYYVTALADTSTAATTRTASLSWWDAGGTSAATVIEPSVEPSTSKIVMAGPLVLRDALGITLVTTAGGTPQRVVTSAHVSDVVAAGDGFAWVEASGPQVLVRTASLLDPTTPHTLYAPPASWQPILALGADSTTPAILALGRSGLFRIPLDGGATSQLYAAPITTEILATQASRPSLHLFDPGFAYFLDACALGPPDGTPPALTRGLDLSTGRTWWLTDVPHYPYLPDLMSVAEPVGTDLYSLVVGE